jgi:hypothetical protein
MRRILVLALVLAAGAVRAQADILDISGFGGYTSLGMKDVNNTISGPVTGVKQTTTTDISNGYVVGLDLRSGLLIPVPFMSVNLRGEYIGGNEGRSAGTFGPLSVPYDIKYSPSMGDVMLGLSFAVDLPGTGLGLGLGVYGGYGEGALQVSTASGGIVAPDLYTGGGFVGEAEARLKYKIYAVLNVYAFGGMRWADLGSFENPASAKFGGSSVNVDFSGATGGGGIDLEF